MIGGMFILFLVLLLLNVPIAFSLGASSLFYLLTSNMNAAVLAQKFYAGIDSFTLLCIPGFMLAGALMNGGGITRRILNFCNAFLGHFTGSLALVNIVASMVFAGISGTAIADVCSLGGMLIPAMVEDGYDDDFSVAVTAASSVVGPIIPPSVPMVIAGSCVSISVGKMFQAGIIPGVLLGLALCVPTYIISVKRHYPKHERSSWKKRLEVTKDAIWALLMPVILLGGILSGIFTPTEASIVTCVYSLIVGVFVYKEIKLSDVHVYHGSNPYAKYPVVLGHEGSGEVIAVGEGVTDLKPGASVVFEPITYCGKCYACRCGHHNVCRELKVLGCIVDGIFQEYVVMPRSQVYEYDASKMTYQQAALCEPFTIGLQANWRGDVRPGDVVLVHGGGPIGLIVANIAKSRGATVIVSEPNESRLAMAKDFGADYSINPMKEDLDAFINKLTDGEGVNVIFEAAGVPALLAHATSQLSPAGRLVAMTFGKEPIPVNFKEINAKELTILGTRHQYQKFPEVVKILPDHLKEVDEITTHVFKAEDFQKAFDTLADRNSGAGKVMLTFA